MKCYTSFTQLEQVSFYYGVSLNTQVRKRSRETMRQVNTSKTLMAAGRAQYI